MTPTDFLNLPKIEFGFKDRLRKQIEEIKKRIKVVPSELEVVEKERCCGKRAFKTEQDALDSISHRAERGRKNKYKPCRAYECENGKWHLTHLTLSEWKQKQNNFKI